MVLYDESEARFAEEPIGPAGECQQVPDWDEVVLHLQAASADEPAENRNSHSNSAWANLIAALVEQQRSSTPE